VSQQKIYNIGIIGAGLIAETHAKAISELSNANLVSIYGRSPEKSQKIAQAYSCKPCQTQADLLKDDSIDIIAITTPSGLHHEPVIEAAKQGKHVICEKPLEISLERIDEMIAAHEKSGTYLGCIFQNRFTDAMKPLKKAIQQGRFGTITFAGVFVPWWRTQEYYTNSWHGTWDFDGGGALMNQSIHMIDMLCDLMGPVESVQGFCETLGHNDMETEDTAVAALKFKNNALGLIHGTTASYPGQHKRFEITGTQGTVIYLEDSFKLWKFSEEKPEDQIIRDQFKQHTASGGVADPGDIEFKNHTKNIAAFIDAIDQGKKFDLDGAEGKKAVELILAIYESSKDRK
jgi:UDP-N-acetyl-2-amino-2-deoxyglucuronate dehydrogenase